MMPIGDPRDGFFYPTLTFIITNDQIKLQIKFFVIKIKTINPKYMARLLLWWPSSRLLGIDLKKSTKKEYVANMTYNITKRSISRLDEKAVHIERSS